MLPPMFEHRQVRVVEFAAGGFGLIVGIGDVADEEVDERVLVLIDKIAIGVAPFAIVLVEAAVVFAADHGVVGQGHATALTVKGLRGAQQGVDGDTEFTGEDFEQLEVGLRHSRLPAADGLPGDIDTFRHLFLRQIVLFAQIP